MCDGIHAALLVPAPSGSARCHSGVIAQTYVFLVSVTRDPQTDTPDKLAEWGRAYGVKPGWTLVTGEPEAIDRLVRELTGDGARPALHAPALYILNDRTGEWVRDTGHAAPKRYTDRIDAMLRREVER